MQVVCRTEECWQVHPPGAVAVEVHMVNASHRYIVVPILHMVICL